MAAAPSIRLTLTALAAMICVARGREGGESRAGAQGSQAGEVTFSEHVAPIVFAKCLPCHRSGEAAPFSLLEHAEVAKRARQIAVVTRSGYMPPWLPSDPPGTFVGERRLSEEEIATLERWAEAGAPEGDPARLPPAPKATDGWQLGEPDLVVHMPEPFVVPPEGLDAWRNFVLPIPVERTRFVAAVELRPGNRRVVHHAVMRVDRTASSRALDARDADAGFPGMDMGLAESPDGQFLGWTPGKVPLRSADGMGWTLAPGMDLVVQLHMVPTGKPEPIQVSVGLHFTEVPPNKRSMVLRLRNDDIDIPAGASAHVVEDSLTLAGAVAVTEIYPHAHFLGKRVEAFAELPDGSRQDLIRIEDWDFNWQDEYRYTTPVRLPSGTRVTMRYTFDNSAENPRNPQVPPSRVQFGNRSLDEMATLTLQLLTEGPDARRLLMEAASRHRVEQDPDSWTARLNLGAILAERGRLEEAAKHLRAGLALEPGSVELHMNLGGVLASLDASAEAEACFREALRLGPGNPQVLSNLAQLAGMRGRWDEAAEHYRAVLGSNPRDGSARRGLGNALFRLGRLDDAGAAYREALAADPRDFQAHYQLGKLAFRQNRLEDATASFLAGLELQPLAEAHADLARVYAARGMQAEADAQLEAAKRLSKPPRTPK